MALTEEDNLLVLGVFLTGLGFGGTVMTVVCLAVLDGDSEKARLKAKKKKKKKSQEE